MSDEPTPRLIDEVRGVVSGNTRRTPLVPSERLSRLADADVRFKCENLQVTGAFKVRGAFALLSVMPEVERGGGVITCSAGNHGLGLALAARATGIPCTVVVAQGTPRVKTAGIERHGARVVTAPHRGYDAAHAWMLENLDRLGGTYVSAYDHPAIMAGNGGTTMLEILEDLPAVRTVIIPCGGGGCSIGAATAARGAGRKVRVVAVNSDASPGMWRSRRDGRAHLTVESAPTIAEGIEGGVSEKAFRLAEQYLDDVIVVPEPAIRRAVVDVLLHDKLLVEGSGAAGAAALAAGVVPGPIEGPVVVVLTGSNIDPDLLEELLAETREAPKEG